MNEHGAYHIEQVRKERPDLSDWLDTVKGQRALPEEVAGTYAHKDLVDEIRGTAALAGPGLRDQFLIEAREDPSKVRLLLESSMGGRALLAAAGNAGFDPLEVVESMTDQEFEDLQFKTFDGPSPEEQLMHEAASKSYTDLNRGRMQVWLNEPLEDAKIAGREVPVDDDAPVADSLTEYEQVTRPKTDDPFIKTEPMSDRWAEENRHFIGLGIFNALPGPLQASVGRFLGEEFVNAAKEIDVIEDDDADGN